MCHSVQDDRWNLDGAVLIESRIRKARLNGRVESAGYLAACDGCH